MFLKSLTLTNLLSFGSKPHTVELKPLNVIIGPNGSGKSNFVEAIALLKAAPDDIREPIRNGGGVGEWIWKGSKNSTARIEAVTEELISSYDVCYQISFNSPFGRMRIASEEIFSTKDDQINYLGRVKNGKIVGDASPQVKEGSPIQYDEEHSMLAQLSKFPGDFDSDYMQEKFLSFAIFRDFDTSRGAPIRVPQTADLPNNTLLPDGSNIGLIFNKLRRNPETRHQIIGLIGKLYENMTDIDVRVEGGTVQLFALENQMVIPATRLSSGTLRFFCLLAILCNPEPPPLICLEEPEVGFHPDLIPTIAELLKAASQRTQLVVTTHSDILVDALSDQPEAVLVAERGDEGTTLTRLDADRLTPWLEQYRLGDLWTRGDIGGTRW